MLDEALVYLRDCNNKKEQFCIPNKNDLMKWLRQCTEKFPTGFRLVAGFCDNSNLKLKKVSS